MISFRYHVISLVAVFLALAIGVTAGTAVIKTAVLDDTQKRLEQVSKELADQQDRNNQLDDLRQHEKALSDQGPEQLLRNRLASVDVLIVEVDGVDERSANALRDTMLAAGAQLDGVLRLNAKLALDNPDDVAQLQSLLASTGNAGELSTDAATRLAVLLRQGLPGQEATSTTTTTAVGHQPDDLRGYLGQLATAGFVNFTSRNDVRRVDGSALRIVVVSGPGAKLKGSRFVKSLLDNLGQTPRSNTVAVEASATDATERRGVFVDSIRNDSTLRNRISTVDDAELFVGRAAVTIALADAGSGEVGHYGVESNADRLLPSAPR